MNAVTNFDITRYDVERIISSSTLLAGELAKRNKEIETTNEAIEHHTSAQNSSQEPELAEEINSGSDWKMVLYQSCPQQPPTVDQLDQKPIGDSNYRSPVLSSLHDLIGIDTINSAEGIDDSTKMTTAHLSNAPSMVTNLSSPGEGSPSRMGLPMLFANSPASKIISSSPLNSWIPSRQLRPAIPMAHMPVFAAWSDA